MGETFLEIVKWAISIGTAGIVLMFVGAIIWRVIFGTKDHPGQLQRWEARRGEHEQEQTAMGVDERLAVKKAEVAAFNNATDLRVLTDAQAPPVGAAYVAQEQVAKTAVTVDQVMIVMMGGVQAFRLFASQFPTIKTEIDSLCDTIEAAVKRSTEDLLREQEKSRQAAGKTVNRG